MSPVAINGVDHQSPAINGVQVKQALNAANETVNEGVYDPTLLSTVDADLAAGNIKDAINIFGKVGTLPAGGVETFEDYYFAVLGAGVEYTPADPGLFSAAIDMIAKLAVNLFINGDKLIEECRGIGAVIGDGTYLDFKNTDVAGHALAVMRQYLSTGTYEEYSHADIVGNGTYTPADEGFFSHASEANPDLNDVQTQYNLKYWWIYNDSGAFCGATLIIGDGSSLSFKNTTAGALRANLMRAVMV